MAYYETDIPTVVSGGNNNGGVFGGEGGWWAGIIGLIAVAAIFGEGGIFGNNKGGSAAVQGALTREQACIDNNFQNLMRETAGISDAASLGFANLNSTICNQQYDTAQMINGLGMNIMQGFNAMNISNLQSSNALQSQLATCCCNLERGQERIGCQMATDTGAIIAAGQANTQRILDYLCDKENQALRDENFALRLSASQERQNNYIVNTLRPFPTASYTVPNPFTGTYGYGYNNGYGCGCGC